MWIWLRYGQYSHIYNGSIHTGLLRGRKNNNTNPYVTRYPTKNVALISLVRMMEGAMLAAGIAEHATTHMHLPSCDASFGMA